MERCQLKGHTERQNSKIIFISLKKKRGRQNSAHVHSQQLEKVSICQTKDETNISNSFKILTLKNTEFIFFS